jgi:CHAT domain-containing protein
MGAAAQTLEPGVRTEGSVSANHEAAYTVTLPAGSYVRVVVEQMGADFAVRLSGPDGRMVAQAEDLQCGGGAVSVSAVAAIAGEYRLGIVLAGRTGMESGRFAIRLDELREATGKDADRAQALAANAGAERLRLESAAESKRDALAQFRAVLPVWQALGDAEGEAAALSGIGDAEYDLGQIREGLGDFERALILWRAAGSLRGQSGTLADIAYGHIQLGDNRKSLSFIQQALDLARASGDKRLELRSLQELAHLESVLGEVRQSVATYEQAIRVSQVCRDRTAEAILASNAAGVYGMAGEEAKALEMGQHSVALRRALNDKRGEAFALLTVATIYEDFGEWQTAREYVEQSLPLRRLAGDRAGEATSLAHLGAEDSALGELEKALGEYHQALEIRRAIGDRRGQATAHRLTGEVLARLGETAEALREYELATGLYRTSGDRRGEASVLADIGSAWTQSGDARRALEYLERGVALERETSDHQGESVTLSSIAALLQRSGHSTEAVENATHALEIARQFGFRALEGEALRIRGELHTARREWEEAALDLEGSLRIGRELENLPDESKALASSSVLHAAQGRLTDALADNARAIEILELLRARFAGPDVRASFFRGMREQYQQRIDLLMRSGRQSDALEASEHARARGLLEVLAQSNADPDPASSPKLRARERQIAAALSAQSEKSLRLRQEKRTDAQLAESAARIGELTAAYRQVQAEIRRDSPHYADLVEPPVVAVSDIQRELLGRDTVLLEYALGEERSFLWAVTSESLLGWVLPARSRIEQMAREVYQELGSSTGDAATGASHLPAFSRALLGPAWPALKNRRVVVVADGALQSIPFAALLDSASHPLVLDHEVVMLPSASALVLLRREQPRRSPASRQIAILGDPVFDAADPRVTGASAASPAPGKLLRSASDAGLNGLVRLPGTRYEAERIAAIAGPGQVLLALDFRASRAMATSPELARYRILHFATHGLIDSVHPELSGLVLSMVDSAGAPQNGFFQVHELYNLRWHADLVVLSGCQTALGKDIRGEGLTGLVRGVMYAGAPRVVASLWKVSDDATARLMEKFYRAMLVRHLSPATALRAAQIEMARDPDYSHPRYWAPFTFQGEWN